MATSTAVHWPFVGRRGELERFADALADDRVDAVLLTGASGVGKSRLAQECLAEAEARGHPVAHAAATDSASAVPLSVLAPLLPAQVDLGDPHGLFESVRRRLHEQGSGRRFVLALDDVDRLDPVSLALLQFLMADGTIFLIATQRAEHALPDTLESRWRGGRAVRVSLEALERPTVDTLLHFALGAPVTATASQALWEASLGNVLYLRELVLTAQRDGSLVDDGGAWRLAGPLTGSSGVVELVKGRLRHLTPQHRTALELLALCEPLAIDDLARHTPMDVLVELEEQGLIQVRADGRRQDVTLAHPLHAQALQRSMPRLRARSLLLAQIDRVEAYGARRRGDPLLLASWRLDATGSADPQLLVQAAELARFAHDLPRAQRLAEAALRHGPDVRAALLLGEALHEQGRYAEAEAALAAATPSVTAPDALRLIITRALNLRFGLSDTTAARELLDTTTAHGVPADDPARAAADVLIHTSAHPAAALARLDEHEPDADRDATRVLWLRARAAALLRHGRLAAAAEAAELGFDLHQQIDYRTVISHPATHLVTLSQANLALGRFAEAADNAQRGFGLAVTDRIDSLTGLFPIRLGAVALARGQVLTAQQRFREALAHLRPAGRPDGLAAAHSGLVIALACRGQLTLDDPLLASPDLVSARAWAWALAAAGQHTAARSRLTEAARQALDAGRLRQAMDLLHDALRLGDLTAGKELAELTAVDGGLAAARIQHALAAVRRDPVALAEAAKRFGALGARLLAAEAATAAAELHRADGNRRAAAACLTQAAALVEGCEGARTPGLVASAGHSPLSEREREIAVLVTQGLSSRDIADRLFISVRTVDNHLQNIYAKTGVNSRTDLASVVGPALYPGKEGRA